MNSPDIIHGDCLAIMESMIAEGRQFSAIVTDPPYHLTNTVKRFGAADAAPPKFGTDGVYTRASAGFMGKKWDGGDISMRPETWRLAWELLPPGGHLVVFGGARTFHRIACAIEDAGFEIRDTLMWLYGTGFPKSHDVSKGIDKMLGAEREPIRHAPHPVTSGTMAGASDSRPWIDASRERGFHEVAGPLPASPEAAAWAGWGTALKPAWEPIILARKPLAGTVAANVLAHRTGALNIDGCRVHHDDVAGPRFRHEGGVVGAGTSYELPDSKNPIPPGRWPANVVHDGSDEVEDAFAVFGERPGQQGRSSTNPETSKTRSIYGAMAHPNKVMWPRRDSGSASRFFYSAKATASDRAGSKHPTIKPVALMRWLVRMVVPPGGTVLDPFAGSGTTGAACLAEGFAATLVDAEAEYITDMLRRFAAEEIGP